MTDDIKNLSSRKLNFFQTMKAVAWGFFGVRKGKGYAEDIGSLNPVHLIIAGIIVMGLFIWQQAKTRNEPLVPLALFRVLALLGDWSRRWRLPAPWDGEQQARLFGDLRFDAGKARDALEWQPQTCFAAMAVQIMEKAIR